MKKIMISCPTKLFWRACPTKLFWRACPTRLFWRASPTRSYWWAGLIFILLIGFSITYAKNLTYAEEVRHGESAVGTRGKAIDRVCTMQVDKEGAKTLSKGGYTYYFCSDSCKNIFAKDPAKYACICPQLFEGCNCGHCTGKGVPCECAEEHAESHTGGHEHEHGHEH
jgi:YHS domain-containing protein